MNTLNAKCRTLAFTLTVFSCTDSLVQAASQSDVNDFARDMGYRYTIVSNHAGPGCPGNDDCFTSRLDLKIPAKPLQGPWSLYFNFVERVVPTDTPVFTFKHVNGDVYTLSTKPDAHFIAGQTYSIDIRSGGHFYSEFAPMPNAFIAVDGLKARTIAASHPVFNPQTGLEQLPFVTPMTDEAKQAVSSSHDATLWMTPGRSFRRNAALIVQQEKPDFVIIPAPISAKHLAGAVLNLKSGVRLKIIGAEKSQLQPALEFLSSMGISTLDNGPVLLVDIDKNSSLPSEAYSINATARSGIRVQARDAAGASYGLRSLAQQVAQEKGLLKPLIITDAPRFPFRGMLIDVARNFHSKTEILKLVEQMGIYKLNRLHLHLGDDEGWRLEIAALPELTEVGSVRCYDLTETRCLLPQLGAGPDGTSLVNGYLSRRDYIDILHAAEARHIEVIPSFDMPGHSRAAIKSMEARYRRLMAAGKTEAAMAYRLVEPADTTAYRSIQNYNDNTLNVCLPATYRFLDTVIDAIVEMHKAAGVPLKQYHIGADETAGAWIKSPACQAFAKAHDIPTHTLAAYFITRVAKDLTDRDIGAAGWSDGILQVDAAKIPSRMQANSWQRLFVEGISEIHTQINQGLDVVLSTPDALYFDMPYEPNPKEPGYDWASRGTDMDKIFGFMPQNLPANAVLIRDIENHAVVVKDNTLITAGHAVVGMQAQLFSETIRSDSQADYMVYPRLLALAERAWHRGVWEVPYKPGQTYTLNDGQVDMTSFGKDYQNFKDRLAVHLPWLDRAGVRYRIPPVGTSIEKGVLEANLPYGNMLIEYRTHGGQWLAYTKPIKLTGHIELRAKASNGRAGRSITLDLGAAQ